MPTPFALLFGVESPPDADLPAAKYADSDARALGHALEALGFPDDRRIVLAGSQATRTALASRLRKFGSSAIDLLLVFYAGPAFREGDHDYLACQDTQADDRAETSLSMQAFLDALAASGCQRLALFLDARGEGMSPTALETFVTRPNTICFTAAQAEEESRVSGSLKAGIWAHHLIEAFAGKAPRAAEDSGLLTARSLQGYLAQEVPRTLRATFREAAPQTPGLLNPSGKHFVLADLSSLLDQNQPTADPRLQPLKRGSLRGETTGKVKSLAGFRKFHRLPDKVNASAKKFVADIAHDDVQHDVDDVYNAVRETLGYKRRDVEGSADRGSGFVRTPDFEYSVSIELADDDVTAVVWRREVAGIHAPEVILSKPFQQVFGNTFDTLVFEFTRPFDLEAWVDHLEEDLPRGVKLRTSSDCSSCDVQVPGNGCVVRLYRDRVEVQGQKTPGSKGLVEAFLHFQDLFSGRRDLQALPLLGV